MVHKIHDARRILKTTKMNARKTTKLMVVGDENANVSTNVDGETIDKLTRSSILALSIKTNTAAQNIETSLIKARKGRAKKVESYHGTGYNLEG